MKDDSLYQKVKAARKASRVAEAKYYEMVLARDKELEEATRPIKEKYASVIKELRDEASEKCGEVWNIAGIFHDYARFFTRDITDIFAIFLTYIEGEKYIPYRNWENHEITENSIIIKDEVNKQYDKIDYPTLESLYENGDLIKLDDGFSNMVDFYNNIGEPNYSFGKFTYLHEFINRLIQYRIDNDKRNVKDITMDDLYTFMCNFISTHPELAQKNKNKRDEMLLSQNEEETLAGGYKKLQVMLQK